MAAAELRLTLPVDRARDAIATALVEQGFAVRPTASGSFDVSGDGLTTASTAEPLAPEAEVRFEVRVTEIAEGALYLAGPNSGSINGMSLSIDGGWVAQ